MILIFENVRDGRQFLLREKDNTRKNRSELYLKYDDSLNISVEYTRFYITEILIILVLNTENNVLLRHAVSST